MKIYAFEWKSGETCRVFRNFIIWIFAPNKKEATEYCLTISGFDDIEDCHISEVPKEEWNDMDIINPVTLQIIESFADYAARETSTDMIATTAF